MSEHTPGPWTLLGTDATMHREIESSDGVLIMAETEYGSETPTNHGDWVLIARAPEMADTIAALTARVKELEKVLTPFGEALKGNWSHQPDLTMVRAGINSSDLRMNLTLGDFRRASAAITKGESK